MFTDIFGVVPETVWIINTGIYTLMVNTVTLYWNLGHGSVCPQVYKLTLKPNKNDNNETIVDCI